MYRRNKTGPRTDQLIPSARFLAGHINEYRSQLSYLALTVNQLLHPFFFDLVDQQQINILARKRINENPFGGAFGLC